MNELTLRCRIRSFQREDASDVYAFASLCEVAYNANFMPHRTLAQTQENLNKWIAANDIFAIELEEESIVIGAVSFRPDSTSPMGWYKLGYTCHPCYQGNGYINEALRKVIDSLFYDRNVPGVAVHVFADNLPSIQVALKSGFPPDYETYQKTRLDGTEVTVNCYRMTKDDYIKRFGGRWFGEIRTTQNHTDPSRPIINRQAVRAVIRKGKTLLMIQSTLGDVKFPGGGIEADETTIEALKREVLEETGYPVSSIGNHLGYIEETTDDFEQEQQIFAMRSDYYIVCIVSRQQPLHLDDYEAALGFHPVWISLDQAIQVNLRCVDPQRWTKRDLKILIFLKHWADQR